jgi:acetylornithine aminotransferase/acetylornithine/N-succinyldiaminopimelate aminotransferase
MGHYFLSNLKQLQSVYPSIKDVRGMGVMLAMELDATDTAKAVLSQLLAKGILINRTHETVLRFLPPYIIEKRHVDEVVAALDLALAKSGTKSGSTKNPKAHEGKPKQSERSH